MTLYEEFVDSAEVGRGHPMVQTGRQRIAQATAADADR